MINSSLCFRHHKCRRFHSKPTILQPFQIIWENIKICGEFKTDQDRLKSDRHGGHGKAKECQRQCPAGRVFQYRVGSGRVLNKIPGSGSGSGRVRVSKNTIGYFRVSFFLSGISGYFGYFRVCRVFLGISGFTHMFIVPFYENVRESKNTILELNWVVLSFVQVRLRRPTLLSMHEHNNSFTGQTRKKGESS